MAGPALAGKRMELKRPRSQKGQEKSDKVTRGREADGLARGSRLFWRQAIVLRGVTLANGASALWFY